MKRLFVILLFLIPFSYSYSQSNDYQPIENTIGIDLNIPDAHQHNYSGETPTKQNIYVPASLCWHHKLYGKLYFESGALYADKTENWGGNASKYQLMMAYVGINAKLKLFKRAYFVPSLDFYFANQYIGEINNSPYSTQDYSFGPTLSFEYFVLKKLSLNLSLLNIAMGPQVSKVPFYNYNCYFIFWRTSCVGVYYNF